MNDRDFKLLVRAYLINDDILRMNPTMVKAWEKSVDLRKKLDAELERFTENEQEELPFNESTFS